MSDVCCPYCEKEQEINHDDGYGYEVNVTHNQQCSDCDKYFTFTTSILYVYDANKADCLNGSKHKFKASKTYPVEFTEMVCSDCGETRKPTEEEMSLIISNNIKK